MSSPVADLEAGLQAMLTLKPPGVSGSRITSLTALCNANVQSESVLVQKLYTHFRKAPGSHKLGVLYVVDSVTRKWTELAKLADQAINSAAPDGTAAAGVYRVKELLPALMSDIILTAPADQKEKISKLVDIWEKGQTFPLQMLIGFKNKLSAPNDSTTPPGSPPADLQSILQGLQAPSAPPPFSAPVTAAAPPPNTVSILEALANLARQNNAVAVASAPTPNGQSMGNPYNVSNAQNNPAHLAASLNQSLAFPPVQPVNVPVAQAPFQLSNGSHQNYASNPANSFAAPAIVPQALSAAAQQQLMLAKAMAEQGIPIESIASILNAMGSQGLAALGAAMPSVPQTQYPPQNQSTSQNSQNSWGVDESRDRNGYPEAVRSPQDRYRRRSRSPSPQRGGGGGGGWAPRERRDEPILDYRGAGVGRSRGDEHRGGRGGYRQRSPARRLSSTPPTTSGDKWIGFDDTIGSGNIKVLSRTLFVGGVTTADLDLRNMFERYGKVQTCIINKEKRHAFVKMVSRADAMAAKDGMERDRHPDSQLRTRWGVGFGPRECSDYTTGVSIIPIGKLTDADRKWMLNAEYGGTGGKPMEPFMVVEEPDIEIGAGVSSKAISRRMDTNPGHRGGARSIRDRDDDDSSNRWRNRGDTRGDNRNENESRRDSRRDDNRFDTVTAPPSMPPVPQFGMDFSGFPSLANGMPMFPPGFIFPGQAANSHQPGSGR